MRRREGGSTFHVPCPGDDGECEAVLTVEVDPDEYLGVPGAVVSVTGCARHAAGLEADDAWCEEVLAYAADDAAAARDEWREMMWEARQGR